MTYEEKKKVVEAAMFLEKNCEKCFSAKQCDCPLEVNHECAIAGWPKHWKIPKLKRWTPEDVTLAKALKEFGVKYIERYIGGGVEGFDEERISVLLITGRANAFKSVGEYQRIDLDTIIEESEG